MLTALARLGEADEAEIAAELERDNTISGKENAVAARAIQPLAEAKAEAWQIAAVDPATPNETRRQTAIVPGRRARPSSSSRTSTATSRWPRRSSTRWAYGSGRSP